jgi:TIR domain
MELIDTIPVRYQEKDRLVMLFIGDLAGLPEREAVDVLIVSAFPNDYVPTPTSLIGALARIGVSVADLAKDREVDLRRFSSCWLSRPIEQPTVHFRRLLCFEPSHRGRAAEVVGDIFRSIVPFTTGNPPIFQIAMPLLASGDQGEPAEVMLEALTEASVHWLSVGLPLDRIKIVVRDSADYQSLRNTFARVKRRHAGTGSGPQQWTFRFDVFVSYCQQNKEEVDDLVRELQQHRPGLRIFLDRLELQPGAAWQQHIFESLEHSQKVICVFSPDYLASKICQEEFHMALFRHRNAANGVLLPLYLYSADLPTYMKLVQYEDVREADRRKMAQAAERLLRQL